MTEEWMIQQGDEKRICGGIGFKLAVTLVLAVVTQLVWAYTVGRMEAIPASVNLWLQTFIPMYVIALPVGIVLITRTKGHTIEKHAFSAGRMIKLFLMTFAVMYIGNIVGTMLMMALTGGAATNVLVQYAMDSDNELLKVLFMVIFGPLLEEIVFRKLVIDRTRRFGEKNAILYSALLFGLFHMNLFQFFYAFGIGLIFGYVYVKSGRIRYTWIMHMLVNLMGSVVAGWLLRGIRYDELVEAAADPAQMEALLQQPGVAGGLVIFALYALVLFVLVVSGIILLIANRKNISFAPLPEGMSERRFSGGMYANAGMIIFFVVTIALTVWLRFV